MIVEGAKDQAKGVLYGPVVDFRHELDLIVVGRRIFNDLDFNFGCEIEEIGQFHYFSNVFLMLNIKRYHRRCIIISILKHILVSELFKGQTMIPASFRRHVCKFVVHKLIEVNLNIAFLFD